MKFTIYAVLAAHISATDPIERDFDCGTDPKNCHYWDACCGPLFEVKDHSNQHELCIDDYYMTHLKDEGLNYTAAGGDEHVKGKIF